MNKFLEIFPNLNTFQPGDLTEILTLLSDEYDTILFFGNDYLSLNSFHIEIEESLRISDFILSITAPYEIIINPEQIQTENKIYKIIYTCTNKQNYTQTYFYKNSSEFDLNLPYSYDIGDPRNYTKSFKFTLTDSFFKQHLIKIEIYELGKIKPNIFLYVIDLNAPNINNNIYFDSIHLIHNKMFDFDDKILYLFESNEDRYILPSIVKWSSNDNQNQNLNISKINLKPYRIKEAFENRDLDNFIVNPSDYLIDSGYAFRNNIQIINYDYYLKNFDNSLIPLGNFKPLQEIFYTPTPIYILTSNVSNVNEGGTVVFNLSTTLITNGTSIPYTITGITADDLSAGSLTGNFIINNNNGTASITLANDFSLDEGQETATLSLNNGKAAIAVTINDTSKQIFVITSSVSNANEGSPVTFTLNTTGVSSGTLVPYTIFGITQNDLSAGSVTGNFTLANRSIVNTCSATTSITLANDNLTEGAETATVSLNNGQASTSITINDTSLTNANYTLKSLNGQIDGAFQNPTDTLIYEGSPVTFILETTGLSTGTLVPYSIFRVNQYDLTSGTLTGNFTLSNKSIVNTCSSTITLTISADQITEGDETLTMTVNNQSVSAAITILDTSKNPPLRILFTAWN
jgi:hypothetical protein